MFRFTSISLFLTLLITVLTSSAQARVSYKVNSLVLSTISLPSSPVISTPGMLKSRSIKTNVAQALEQDRYAAIWEQSSGPAWQARHGLTSAEYQTTFNQLVSQGYRLVDVSGYSVNGQDRYAAIWKQSSGPAWQARHGLTSAEYQTTFNQLVSQGYRLIHVSGYSVNGQDRYAAIWEQSSGSAWQARHGLTSAEYQTTFNQLTSQGYRLIHVSGYSVIQP